MTDSANRPPNEEEEDKEKGVFDARSKFRTTAGLVFEVGAEAALDFGSAIPGSQQAGSAIINYLAQRIRGGEFNKGEFLAAIATSQIPGLNAARALTRGGRFSRAVAKGGVTGGITSASTAGIDEGRRVTAGELGTSIVAGATLGGTFDLAPSAFKGNLGKTASEISEDTKFTLQQLKRRLEGGDLIFNPEIYYTGSLADSGTVGAARVGGIGGTDGSQRIGKITARNLPKLEDFLLGKKTSLDRTTAGLVQDPNFKLTDFLRGIEEELSQIRAKYPRIDVDTNLQRFKWQWHHINPEKMPVDFYVGLDNVNDRNVITDTLLRETGVSAGMNPTNRIGLPTEVHDEITDWLDTEIGRRSQVIRQKISDELGFNLTLTGKGSRAANLQFNQLFASVPLEQRLTYIREYGQKIAESTQILDNLMQQFDIFYEIPSGFRLDIDVNTMERMLARLNEGAPTIKTLREIIADVTEGLRIPATDAIGRQAVAIPRDTKLIRAIDIEGQLRDAAAGQSTLNQRQINSLAKELEEINQMNLDIKGASLSAYLRNYYKKRFGGRR